MSRAVRFDEYGGIDVLKVVDVDPPSPGPGQLLVRVRAAGINPGEIGIREGRMHASFPATFPSGEGSDLAGVVEQVGEGVTECSAGDEVIGFTHNRASHAELVVVEAANVTPKPPGVPWEVAGGLYVAGCTAWAAVHAVGVAPSDTVAVSGAAGGVGSIVVQLARQTGARVIGIAAAHNHEWLSSHGVIPVAYGDGLEDRIRAAAPDGLDAFIDCFGGGYVEMALHLGVAPGRVETIIDFAAAARHEGVQTAGSMTASSADVLAELAARIDRGELEVPVAAVYPLDQVREAYTELEKRHTRGKIVLVP